MKYSNKLEIHKTAEFFYRRSKDAIGIVVLTNRPELLINQYPLDIPIYIASDRLTLRRSRASIAKLLPHAQLITVQSLTTEFLSDKFLVCVDYLDTPRLSSWFNAKRLVSKLTKAPLISMVTIHKSRHWHSSKLQSLSSNGHTMLVGYSRRFVNSISKSEIVVLGGRYIDFNYKNILSISLLAILHVFNEQDVIASTIKHLLDQGTSVHIIDNWSTDNTYPIIQALAKSNSRVTYERFPNTPNNSFELAKILKRVTDVAREKSEYDWVMLNDADEIRWSPWPNTTLQQAVSFIDHLGYSAIDYTVFNFVPTKEGFSEIYSLADFFKYGEFSGVSGHFVQIKTWKNVPNADLAATGGHNVEFNDKKIFPLKFFLGHYPIRSTDHGRTKIFKERRSRYSKTERNKGWHVHYDNLDNDTSFLGDKTKLINSGDKNFHKTYVIELISGIGIKRD